MNPGCPAEQLQEAVDALAEQGTKNGAARSLGLHRNTYVNRLKRAQELGYKPHDNTPYAVPPEHDLHGVSRLEDGEGNVRLRWVKTRRDEARRLRAMREIIANLGEKVPRTKPIKPPKSCYEKLATLYPWGDPHLGLYSWAAETGDDFDLEIAERDLCAAMDYLVHRSPPSRRGILINLGDLFHAENMEGITTRSGHVLDMDTRFPRMIDVGVRTIRRCLERMLEKHEIVEIVNAPGNHDETLAFFLNTLFRNTYENEPRIIVHDEPTMRHYIQHGKCLIGIVHGHQTKDKDLPGIMAAEKPVEWGQTKFRYYYRGHHHHDTKQEYNGCVVEQFRTLAAGDAYAVGSGYLSGRDMKAIVMHEDAGEQTRFTCGIDVLRGEVE